MNLPHKEKENEKYQLVSHTLPIVYTHCPLFKYHGLSFCFCSDLISTGTFSGLLCSKVYLCKDTSIHQWLYPIFLERDCLNRFSWIALIYVKPLFVAAVLTELFNGFTLSKALAYSSCFGTL